MAAETATATGTESGIPNDRDAMIAGQAGPEPAAWGDGNGPAR